MCIINKKFYIKNKKILPAKGSNRRPSNTKLTHLINFFQNLTKQLKMDDIITFKRLLHLYKNNLVNKEKERNFQENLFTNFMGCYFDICCSTREDCTVFLNINRWENK